MYETYAESSKGLTCVCVPIAQHNNEERIVVDVVVVEDFFKFSISLFICFFFAH